VGSVPDSLISQFSTKNGRKVFDGGGVVPDIKLDQEELSNLAIELVTRFVVFDYATRFAATVASIPQPESFRITDSIYSEFTRYVKENSFNYDSRTQDALTNLVKIAREEKYFDVAGEEFKSLEAKLKPDLDKDLQLFRDEISKLLEDEIVTRFYFQKGAIRATIDDDPTIIKAREILSNPGDYAGYFTPGTVISPN